MPSGVNTFPVGPSRVSGTEVTVDYFARQPLTIARTIQEFRQRDFFVSDLLYGNAGVTQSGSVVYHEVTGVDDQFTSSDFELIAPGGEFPIVGVTATSPKAAVAQKYGAKMQITKEARSRNQLSKFRNDVVALYNTQKRKSDRRAMAPVNAAITALSTLTSAVGTAWSNPAANIRKDLETARHALTRSILGLTEGYNANTVLVGADVFLNIKLNDTLMDLFYKSMDPAAARALIQSGNLDGLLGFEKFRMNPYMGVRDVWMFEAGRVGGAATEYPLELETWYREETQSNWVQLSASDVYYVDQPKALLTFSGI
jgi:hypothetical protein